MWALVRLLQTFCCICSYAFYLAEPHCSSLGFVGFDGLSLGMGHTLLLGNDGTVWGTGLNSFGQLGIDPTNSTTITNFVQIVSGRAKAVAAGGEHSMILRQDGSVW